MKELIEQFILTYILCALMALGAVRFFTLYLESKGSKYSQSVKGATGGLLYSPLSKLVRIYNESKLFPTLNLLNASSVGEWLLSLVMIIFMLLVLSASLFYFNKLLDRRVEKKNKIASN